MVTRLRVLSYERVIASSLVWPAPGNISTPRNSSKAGCAMISRVIFTPFRITRTSVVGLQIVGLDQGVLSRIARTNRQRSAALLTQLTHVHLIAVAIRPGIAPGNCHRHENDSGYPESPTLSSVRM